MKKELLKDLYLNWKGLEMIHNLKYILKIVLITLSLIFTIISLTINNVYILIASLIVLFLEILSENNKEYFLKYKEIYESIQKGESVENYKDWISFLERTSGINSMFKWFIKRIYKKELELIKLKK